MIFLPPPAGTRIICLTMNSTTWIFSSGFRLQVEVAYEFSLNILVSNSPCWADSPSQLSSRHTVSSGLISNPGEWEERMGKWCAVPRILEGFSSPDLACGRSKRRLNNFEHYMKDGFKSVGSCFLFQHVFLYTLHSCGSSYFPILSLHMVFVFCQLLPPWAGHRACS